ncbi:pyridoxamine 5'-phosphate oxidase family protein [Synechococcus sp. PCC 6312]|uniref:pyridoxamine 5'-phosphate oxidase family protein n=1 Tax=Synechococcus sp. (strain ATCC 27167 / PCC 6312) TaxID=195253 RepID=UPI00029F216D|nr:pyridoxamine 5'-phosphate oxidase family protein [Synechococcus sp. PCC 6312]AFY60295.1 pyridoxamine 5'-phosphate oxidase-related, FMN binding protein [Synechococcus sp. PCC 6312]
MTNPGWAYPESPFHAGELAIQTRLGVQERIDKQGRRIIRDYLPEQQRQFFQQLPYVIVGLVDTLGRPWASILVGQPGFLSSPDERTLVVSTQLWPGDPLIQNLATGVDIGFLGIELHSRRRNRLNGVVTAVYPDHFVVEVGQSFGNCPQYIQARTVEFVDRGSNSAASVRSIPGLGLAEQTLIQAADTFFIATAYQDESAGRGRGVDVSHRGGKPGFVKIEGRTLTIPDFSGNLQFNTFGNLELNPLAGLIFIDFIGGDVLYLTGRAWVIWDGDEIATYEGAERLLRFELDEGYYGKNTLPVRWSEPDFSPFLQDMGPWVAPEEKGL